jgi:hypothetical protein
MNLMTRTALRRHSTLRSQDAAVDPASVLALSRTVSYGDLPRSNWMLLGGVLAVALALRLLFINTWSLWQDEETSIYFSQNLQKAFARSAPVYFYPLRGLFDAFGISVTLGRLFAAVCGVASIYLTYLLGRRLYSTGTGLVAAALLAVCLHHLFWSQSIRYYTLALMLQCAASLLFFDGFETASVGKLMSAGILLSVAVFAHFTSMLLFPVWLGYAVLCAGLRTNTRGRFWTTMAAFSLPSLAAIVLCYPQLKSLQASGATGGLLEVAYPSPLLLRFAAYLGIPMLLIGLTAIAVRRELPTRSLVFAMCLAYVPILEVLVLGRLALANVTIHHAFISTAGCALLTAMAIAGWYRAGYRRTTYAMLAGSGVYYLAFLVAYYTTMHGDRPRWKESINALKVAAGRNLIDVNDARIFATVPDLVAHYLGIPPGSTQGQRLVEPLSESPAAVPRGHTHWYVVESSRLPDVYRRWLQDSGELVQSFPVKMGPIDRSVMLYRCVSDSVFPSLKVANQDVGRRAQPLATERRVDPEK